jgi:hypothetical protein
VNEAEGIGCTQEGGKSLLMFGQLTEYLLDMPGSEKDAKMCYFSGHSYIPTYGKSDFLNEKKYARYST